MIFQQEFHHYYDNLLLIFEDASCNVNVIPCQENDCFNSNIEDDSWKFVSFSWNHHILHKLFQHVQLNVQEIKGVANVAT